MLLLAVLVMQPPSAACRAVWTTLLACLAPIPCSFDIVGGLLYFLLVVSFKICTDA